MTHQICDGCETVQHCMKFGCIPLQPLPERTTSIVPQSTKMDIKTLLDQTPRLRAWAAIGPVQHAELARFAQLLLDSRATAVTCDGVLVSPGTEVWVFSSTGRPVPTTVRPTEALTNYTLFGLIPVAHSFSTEAAAETYREHNR